MPPRLVLEAKGVKPIVMRNGAVYGRQGSLTSPWFEAAYRRQALEMLGDGRNRWSMVHVDDVARAYLAAAEQGVSGEAFNLTDGAFHTVGEMVRALGRVARNQGEPRALSAEEVPQKESVLAEALCLDQAVDASKAGAQLGWVPRHKSFVAGVGEYYRAWKAYYGDDDREIEDIGAA